MANAHLLSVLIWLPVIGGALILGLGSARAEAARWASLAVAVVTFLWSLRLLTGFDYSNPGMQFVEQHAWIPAWGIHYNLGADGIAIALILLTTLVGMPKAWLLSVAVSPVNRSCRLTSWPALS